MKTTGRSLQQDLENMLNWPDLYLLKYNNTDMCCTMTIKEKKDGPVGDRIYHDLDGTQLRTSEKERDLGVILNKKVLHTNIISLHLWVYERLI